MTIRSMCMRCLWLGACLCIICVSGCAKPEKRVALKIDNISITVGEFEDAFLRSRYADMGPEGREIFLDHYIDTKLILKQAESLGLGKDPEFLKEIQRFWEQALLKRMIDRKTHELAAEVRVPGKMIKDYYEANRQAMFADKSYQDVRDQIRWLLLRQKQSEALEEWTIGLRSRAKLKIKRSLLGIK